MTKTETAQQLAAAANAKRVQELSSQIEAVRQARHHSVEDLAQTLEPLALAMAALADETRQTLAGIQEQAAKQQTETADAWRKAASSMVERANAQKGATESMERASQDARKAMRELQDGARGLAWRVWIIAVLVGVLGAALAAFWISQHQLSEPDRAALRLGQEVTARHQQLTPAQQKEFGRLMGWQP